MHRRRSEGLTRLFCVALLGWVASCNEACDKQHRSSTPSTTPATRATRAGSGGTTATTPSDSNKGTEHGAADKGCDTLVRDYDAALRRAKACNPMAATAAQCRERVDSQLPCPCPTYANGSDREALARLSQLAASWRARDCAAEVMCAQVMCQPARSGNCQSVEGSRGACLDR